MMTKQILTSIVVALSVVFCVMVATVVAQGDTGNVDVVSAEPATPDEQAAADPVGTVTKVFSDIRSGNWRFAVAGILSLLMFLLRGVREHFAWFKGDRGGAVLLLALSLGASLAATLASSVKLDLMTVVGALGIALTAGGGYTVLKRIIWPADKAQAPSEG